jgi:hypothetical protein
MFFAGTASKGDQLMDSVSLWEGLDYEEECSDSNSGESGGESEEELDSDETDDDNDAASSSNDSD